MTPFRADLKQAVRAGAAATFILTALMYFAPLAGLPRIDMAAAIGGAWGEPAMLFSIRWWIGMMIFLSVGVILWPALFLFAAPALYGRPWQCGIEWGVAVWGVAGVIAMIYMGLSFHEPFVSRPGMSALASFAGHLIYGGILGMLAGAAVGHARERHVFT